MYVADVNAIRELDRAAMASGTPGLTLMERAGEGLAEAAKAMLAGVPSPKVLVVCGKGNNGGDGFAVSRLLLDAGIQATPLLLFDKSHYQSDALTNLKRLLDSSVKIIDGTDPNRWPDFAAYPLIIDAILGTGFSGAIQGPLKECINRINASDARVLSVDTPSGVDCDTGETASPAVLADVTVAMGLPKVGQLFYPARTHVGELKVQDIGFSPEAVRRLCGRTRLITPPMARAGLRLRQGPENKFTCGRVLVVAGSAGFTGAACLAARAALRSGAGMVTLCVPKSLSQIFEIKLTEEIKHPLSDNGRGYLLASHKKAILNLLAEAEVLVLGPGLGRNPSTQALVRALVKESPVPVVLDADGINAFQGKADLLKKAKSPLVLTPHEGELRRLIGPKAIPASGSARVCFVRDLQPRLGAGLLLKGPSTLISFSAEEVYINTSGNPGMATAGVGDVLSGLIGGLYAQNKDLLKATLCAAHLHGLSGDAASLDLTEYALTAGDLIDYLPRAFKALQE
jgi:ADP-dependent NAD(P)H-hydrate dehydratase / NAD(P)H-hydrate epimerase